MQLPDSTAVVVALWRAAHLVLDEPPYILEDRIGLRLTWDADVLRAAAFDVPFDGELADPDDNWPDRRGMADRVGRQVLWRGSVLARARFVEDLVVGSGAAQYVILGAGLDSFSLRRPELAPRLTVFEVDEPSTQAWKRERLLELGMDAPAHLRFAPVDFESGESWVDKIAEAGFDRSRSAIIASLGVTQYITKQATLDMLQQAAGLRAGTTLVMTFMLPKDIVDTAELDLRTQSEERAASRGHPWVSFFAPEQIVKLAREAGFVSVRHVSPGELTQLYFRNRTDSLRPSSSEHLLVATAG